MMFNILIIRKVQIKTFEISSSSSQITKTNKTKDSFFSKGFRIAGGSVNLFNHYENQCGSFSGSWELMCLKIYLYILFRMFCLLMLCLAIILIVLSCLLRFPVSWILWCVWYLQMYLFIKLYSSVLYYM